MIQSEVSLLRRVKHPNIVLLIEEIDTQNDLYLVMELVKVLHQHNRPTSKCHVNCRLSEIWRIVRLANSLSVCKDL